MVLSLRGWRRIAASVFVVTVFLIPGLCLAQTSELEAIRGIVKNLEQQLQKAMERIDQLEQEKTSTSARVGQVEKTVQGVQSTPSLFNPAIGMVIDATANNNGVEVEEAAALTTALPWNLTAKGGRFFSDFGRLPKYHQDALPFVNFPLAIDRMIGGESQADGAELYYLFPTPFFLRATLGGMNKIGAENERVDNTKFRSESRFTYLGRLQSYFDLTDNHSIEVGSSLAYTPSVRISGDSSGSDRVLTGIDLTYRYQPLASTLYQGLVWGSELFTNSERVAVDDSAKRRRSYGGYSYAELKLNKNWSTGFLFDYAPVVDNPSHRTLGYSPFLTWQISEFNRLRFQYSHLSNNFRADKAENGNQFFLQWTTVMGVDIHGFRVR